jgi:hypothetical protein
LMPSRFTFDCFTVVPIAIFVACARMERLLERHNTDRRVSQTTVCKLSDDFLVQGRLDIS